MYAALANLYETPANLFATLANLFDEERRGSGQRDIDIEYRKFVLTRLARDGKLTLNFSPPSAPALRASTSSAAVASRGLPQAPGRRGRGIRQIAWVPRHEQQRPDTGTFHQYSDELEAPSSSLPPGSSQIPRAPRRFEDLAPTTSYINWVGSVVPVEILLRANKDVPFIPGPCTIDVPLIACSQSSAPVGDALAAVFGEQEYDPPINAGRRRMQEMCRWNGELLLARVRLSLDRLEDQSLWDRRLRASIKVKSVVLVFGHLGMPATLVLGDKKTAMDRVID